MMLIAAIVIDKVNLSDVFSEEVNPRWLIPIIIASMVGVSVSLLTLVNSKILKKIQILTTLDITAYLTMVAIFYGMEIKYQWLLVVIFGNKLIYLGSLGIIIAITLLKSATYLLMYIMPPLLLALIACQADGIFNNN